MSSALPSWLRPRYEESSDSERSAGAETPTSVRDDIFSSDEEECQFALEGDAGNQSLPPAAQKLPASLRMAEILNTVGTNRVTCILGDTGCGKSTVIPYFLCSSAAAGVTVRILCTQPRRMAAISLCEHVQSRFFGQRNHPAVGYRVRGQRTDKEDSSLVYVTAGYLKTMLTHEPDEINKFTHLILDEVHERGIDSDFLSLIVKRLLALPENRTTKLVVMSATLESDLFVDYFESLNGGMRPVTIDLTCNKPRSEGYKIDEYFIDELSTYSSYADACLGTFSRALNDQPVHGVLPGDLTENVQNLAVDLIIKLSRDNYSSLVFLPGLGEILSVQEKLTDALERRGEVIVPVDVTGEAPLPSSGHYFHIFVLHSTMPYEEQRLALKEPSLNARHIVLSTNVAESSLTVPNVNVVIDSGLKRTNSYDSTNRVYRLTTVWCSKASCMQRRGRTGRVCAGKYYKLFTEEFYLRKMLSFDTPEVVLSDLSCVFLNAKYISEFWRQPHAAKGTIRPSDILRELITPPRQRNVRAAVIDLFEAGILRHEPDEMSELSLLGTLATRLHVEPQIARILYFAWLMGATCEGVILAAACSIDTEVIKGTSTKYQPGCEESFCRGVYNTMWYRTVYDLGSFSEPIALRNLLWAWLSSYYGVNVGAPTFHRQAVYAKEFDSLKRVVINLCVQFSAWIQESIGDERAENEAEMLKELMSEKRSQMESVDQMIRTIFSCHDKFDKLKALLAIAMNTRLLTADSVGAIDGVPYDEACSIRIDKIPETAFIGCESDLERFARVEELAGRLTGRRPEKILLLDRVNDLSINTSWIVHPGKDYVGAALAELKQIDPATYLKAKEDYSIVVNSSSEYYGLVAPISVRTCMQFFDRRFSSTVQLNGGYRTKVKIPSYSNGLHWGRIDRPSTCIDDVLSGGAPQWLPINVNTKSPVGWLHRVPSSMRDSYTDRFWAIAGKIIGSTKNLFEDQTPMEARAYNVTILPVGKGGRVAAALLLASLPFREGLVAQVAISDAGQYEVLRIKVQGRFFELNRCQQYPLTLRMLRSVSAVRQLIAKATDIAGTSTRGRLSHNSNQEENKTFKQLTQEAVERVAEIQGGTTNFSESLSREIENLIACATDESLTSLNLFPAQDGSPRERLIMLIPNTGGAYGEVTLDPTIWAEPECDELVAKQGRKIVFRKDQIFEIQKNVTCNGGAVYPLVSDRDKDEAPIVRLAGLGFSVEEISRYLERKLRLAHANRPIDSIMKEQLDWPDFSPSAQWLEEPRRRNSEDFEIPSSDVGESETSSGSLSVLPPVPASLLKSTSSLVLPIRDRKWDIDETENIPFTKWDNIQQPNSFEVIDLDMDTSFRNHQEQQEIPCDSPVRELVRRSDVWWWDLWHEVLAESRHPTVGLDGTRDACLINLWNRIIPSTHDDKDSDR